MPINVTPTAIPDVLVIEPKVFGDDRGWFFESFNQKDFSSAIGKQVNFVQDNHSSSKKGVLRGLHYQMEQTQGKLVRVAHGAVLDVVVDLRQSSLSNCGYLQVLLMAFWRCLRLLNFYIKPLITGMRPVKSVLFGMTPL